MYHPRVVYFFFTQAHPTAILCFSMRLLSFFCSAVSSLSFSMGFALVGIAAFITAVCLSPKTTSANAKNLTTPTTSDFQRHYRFNRSDNSISGVAYNPDDVVRINECVVSGLYTEIALEARSFCLRASFYFRLIWIFIFGRAARCGFLRTKYRTQRS